MDRLNPCPICGGDANLVSVPCKPGLSPHACANLHWWVVCINGCISTYAYTSEHEAVETWNKIAKRIGEGEKYYIAERSEDGQT